MIHILDATDGELPCCMCTPGAAAGRDPDGLS